MYDFHYFIKHKYGNNTKLLFTDTDSRCYEIQIDNSYKDMKAHLSNYINDFCDDTNKKVIDKFKDECAVNPIKELEFVGLRSKMFSIKTENGLEARKAKEIRRDKIDHNDYKI